MKLYDIDQVGSMGFKFVDDREYQVILDYRNHTTEEGIWCVRVDVLTIFMFLGERVVVENYFIIPLTSIDDSDLFGSMAMYVFLGNNLTKFNDLIINALLCYSKIVKHKRSSLIV